MDNNGLINLLIADANLCHADIEKLKQVQASGKMWYKRSYMHTLINNSNSAKKHLKLLEKLGDFLNA